MKVNLIFHCTHKFCRRSKYRKVFKGKLSLHDKPVFISPPLILIRSQLLFYLIRMPMIARVMRLAQLEKCIFPFEQAPLQLTLHSRLEENITKAKSMPVDSMLKAGFRLIGRSVMLEGVNITCVLITP